MGKNLGQPAITEIRGGGYQPLFLFNEFGDGKPGSVINERGNFHFMKYGAGRERRENVMVVGGESPVKKR